MALVLPPWKGFGHRDRFFEKPPYTLRDWNGGLGSYIVASLSLRMDGLSFPSLVAYNLSFLFLIPPSHHSSKNQQVSIEKPTDGREAVFQSADRTPPQVHTASEQPQTGSGVLSASCSVAAKEPVHSRNSCIRLLINTFWSKALPYNSSKCTFLTAAKKGKSLPKHPCLWKHFPPSCSVSRSLCLFNLSLNIPFPHAQSHV